MTEVEKQGIDNPSATDEIKVDAFGQGEAPVPKVEEKKEEKNDALPENHPTVVALKKQIEDVKKEYGGNLSGQRSKIEKLESEIAELRKGNNKDEKKDEDVLYKDIKWSKDLSKEDLESMTDTEIKQMDEIAEMKTNQNRMYQEGKGKQKQEETSKVENLQALVKNTAKELATGEDGTVDIELANQIIESTKQFVLEGLDEATVKERVLKAHTLLPNYTPPKEQTKKDGKPVKVETKKDDPFGVDAIIAEATKESSGNYSL